MKNEIVRTVAKDAGVKLWQIAERVGITDSNFSRKLRRELPDEERERILRMIDELAAGKGEEDHATNADD